MKFAITAWGTKRVLREVKIMVLQKETFKLSEKTVLYHDAELGDMPIQTGLHLYYPVKKKSSEQKGTFYTTEHAQWILPSPGFPTLPNVYVRKSAENDGWKISVSGVLSEAFRAVILIIWAIACAGQLFIFNDLGMMEAIRKGVITPFLLGIAFSALLFLIAKIRGVSVTKDFAAAYREKLAGKE
ncbi:MAG: hypothetical protein IJM69_01440 [Firmicutes bacterium]|nr:hypothetical protein [Bacillota bacterium]